MHEEPFANVLAGLLAILLLVCCWLMACAPQPTTPASSSSRPAYGPVGCQSANGTWYQC